MRTEYNIVDIQDVMNYWKNGYKLKKEGETINSFDFYYDQNKGDVVFVLNINEVAESVSEVDTAI